MKYFARFAALALISLPLFASAATAADLQAQAQALLQQVAALQAQLGASGGATVAASTSFACPQLGVTLRVGSSGADVSRLQQFLAHDPSIYPEAQVTGYFGTLTQAAVQRWQAKYSIVSAGSPATTGYGVVGPRTAAAMSLQCSSISAGGGTVTTGGGAAPLVGGFIQVSPISGNAPLSTKIVATVNTVNSCGAATYTLDYGDGTIPSQIPVPANACSSFAQTYSHLYTYGGIYIVKLSAGGHETTATVVVSGASAPTTPTVTQPASISVNAPSSAQNGSTVTLSWNAQNAPANSAVTLVTDSAGRIKDALPTSGSISWKLPGSSCDASGSCHAVADNPFVWHTENGQTYQIYAKLYTPADANLGGGLLAPTTNLSYIATSAPAPLTVTASASTSYPPFSLTPNVGGNPLAVQVQFTYAAGYALEWGDGSTGQGTCSSQPNAAPTCTANHTYLSGGAYTVKLTRGSQVDTASVTIAQ